MIRQTATRKNTPPLPPPLPQNERSGNLANWVLFDRGCCCWRCWQWRGFAMTTADSLGGKARQAKKNPSTKRNTQTTIIHLSSYTERCDPNFPSTSSYHLSHSIFDPTDYLVAFITVQKRVHLHLVPFIHSASHQSAQQDNKIFCCSNAGWPRYCQSTTITII